MTFSLFVIHTTAYQDFFGVYSNLLLPLPAVLLCWPLPHPKHWPIAVCCALIRIPNQISETTCLHNLMAVAKSGSVGLILSNSPEHRDQTTYIGIFKTGAVRIYI